MAVMGSPMTPAPVPLGDYVPEADQRVQLDGLSWDDYETLLALRGERSRPRLTYLDGTVELMSPSGGHEYTNSMLARVLEAYCLERGIPFIPVGNWTVKNEKDAGLEPDECYVFDAKARTKAVREQRPDLAIEVTWTSGGIDKLEVYRRLGIAEVWYWKADAIAVYVLGPDGYEQRERSACLPDVDLALLCRLARCETVNEAVAQLRAALTR